MDDTGKVADGFSEGGHWVRETKYANTDFDLKSDFPFDTLHRELEASCCVLHYTHGGDGRWHAIVESNGDCSSSRDAARDIASILGVLRDVSPTAKAEFAACSLREFNIGFECWDTWGYTHAIPAEIVRAIADSGCTIAVTLYPMRKPDGSPKI